MQALTEFVSKGMSLHLIAALLEPFEPNTSIRALAALDQAGIMTVDDLMHFYEKDLEHAGKRTHLLKGVGEVVGAFIMQRVPPPPF